MEDFSGTFELVNPAEIVVDHRYQRDEKQDLIQKIAAGPNWAAFGVVTCFRRANGVLYAVDGQQRLKGVLSSETPPKRIPVIAYAVSTIEEEARIFGVINEYRKSLAPVERHTARVVAKDPSALAITRAVEKAGYSIGVYADNSRTIGSVLSLNRIYDTLGEEGIVQTLVAIREAWPDDKSALSAGIMKGVAEIIGESNGNYNRAKTVTAMSRTTPAKVLRKAEEFVFDMGGTKQQQIRRAFKALAKL